jgi:hypothetical protein
MGKIRYCALLITLALFALSADTAMAGPPFVSDDPEPVLLRHWECYIASAYNHSAGGATGTSPHFEVNYGAATETQLHIIAPVAYSQTPGNSFNSGLGDVELGIKYRFMRETTFCPQAGVFPLIELPSGDSSGGLGAGRTSAFLPVWLQKSFGPWTSYAGGGYWFNKTAAGDKDYWQTGWEIQRDINKALTIGAEIFNFSRKADGGSSETGFNIGAIINFSEEHHLLLSAGGDTVGPNTQFAYAAFQWTISNMIPPGIQR